MEVSTEELNYLVDMRAKELIKQQATPKAPSPWSKFSNEIDMDLADWDPHEAYSIKTAFCTIIRCALGAKRVVRLDEDEIDQAKDIVHILLTVVNDWNEEAAQ